MHNSTPPLSDSPVKSGINSTSHPSSSFSTPPLGGGIPIGTPTFPPLNWMLRDRLSAPSAESPPIGSPFDDLSVMCPNICYTTLRRLAESIPMVTGVEQKYKRGSVIGYGSFGNVYLIADSELKDAVMKEFPLTTITACSTTRHCLQWQSFLVEVLTLRDIRHDHITHFFESFRTSDKGFLIMKRAPGVTLLALLLNRNPRIKEPEFFAQVLIQLLSALQYLHERGIAHRDVKPENVLIDEETGHTTLIDFGSVWVEGMEEKSGGTSAEGGGTMGTVMYLSSETVNYALGFRSALTASDHYSSDIYAVGILTHIALLGTHPYYVHRADTLETLQSKLSIPFPTTLEESTGSVVLDAILPRMLCKEGSLRPTCAELLAELGALATHTSNPLNLCQRCMKTHWKTPLSVCTPVSSALPRVNSQKFL